MKNLMLAIAITLLLPSFALADNSGSKLYQCVTLRWEVAGKKFPPVVNVEVDIYGKTFAKKGLTMKDTAMTFEFAEDVSAKGKLHATFEEYDGVGTLVLDELEVACDFSGAYPMKTGKVTDFTYTGKFDY